MEVQKNKEYIVEIIDNGFEGEGIAKIDGMTVFIPNAIKGETIKILVVKVNKNFAYGKILEIINPSSMRAVADCQTYKVCGGCNLRHIKYEDTLRIKKAIVENCLHKELKREVPVQDVIGMSEPKYYRNKLIYPVGTNKNNETIMGVFANRTHNIVEVKECFIQDKLNQEIATEVLKIIKKYNIKPYNESTGNGSIRHIIVRCGKQTNEMMIILVCNDKNQYNVKEKNFNNLKNDELAKNSANEIAENSIITAQIMENEMNSNTEIKAFEKELITILPEKYPQIKSIVKNINNKNTNVIMGEKNINLFGEGYITDKLGDYVFKISPNSFYQVNPVQTVKLYNTAITLANLDKKDTVLDLYCGIGTISIFLAKHVKKVIGVEIVEAAIEDAKENAKLNSINNVNFYAGDVELLLPKILKDKENIPDVLFVDPPRKGLDKNTIENIKKIKPKKVVYISCNPATFARDIALLEDTYELGEVQPVDMFCGTSHVECVCVLKLK